MRKFKTLPTGRPVKHGHSRRLWKSPTYSSWHSMISRCAYESSQNFRWYGAKGITFCPEWKSFESFLKDMGERPPGTTLGRKDHSLGYSKENCAWQSDEEQCEHRGRTQFWTYKGTRRSISGWARHFQISRTGFRHWVKRYGFAVAVHNFSIGTLPPRGTYGK